MAVGCCPSLADGHGVWEPRGSLVRLPPLGRGVSPCQPRVSGVSCWPLWPPLLHLIIVPSSSAQGHERPPGMRAVLLTLHLRGHSAGNQINTVSYLYGVSVLVGEEKTR